MKMMILLLAVTYMPICFWATIQCCIAKACNVESLVIPRPSNSALAKARRLLKSVEPMNIPKQTEGGLLFDGTVIKNESVPRRDIQLWLVKIGTVYRGENFHEGDPISIASPSIRNGGVNLKVNTRYRFFVIDLNESDASALDRYYVWHGLVLKLPEKKKA